MPLSLGRTFLTTTTAKVPLANYERWLTYSFAMAFIALNLAYGKAAKLAEVCAAELSCASLRAIV